MKLWTVLFLVMITIVVAGLLMQGSILKTTERISQDLDLIQEAVRNDQWQEAMKLRDEIAKEWQIQQQSWVPLLHNHDLDIITIHLARLKSFLETEEKGDALAEIAEMEIQLLQLHQEEVLTLRNVL